MILKQFISILNKMETGIENNIKTDNGGLHPNGGVITTNLEEKQPKL